MSNTDWHNEETYKSLITISNNGLKFIFLINGGAVIALLTFLGNLLKNNNGSVAINMSLPMGLFLAGIVVAGIAYITAYVTQLRLYNEKAGTKKHEKWLRATLALAILGIISFGAGSICTLLELQSYARH